MATGRHTITHAKNIFHGNAQHYGVEGGKRGIRGNLLYYATFGAPAAIDDDGLVTKQAFSSDASATYGWATTVTGAGLSGGIKTFDIPRNVTITTSDSAALSTFIIKGTDLYGVTMMERMAARASDATTSGKKAFKTITHLESGGAGTTGVFYAGFGNRFGLPHRLTDRRHVVSAFVGDSFASVWAASDCVTPTYTVTETHSATTAATGPLGLPADTRGTWKPSVVPDASVTYALWYKVSDPDTRKSAYGIDQAAT
jgi:hypothetical protein